MPLPLILGIGAAIAGVKGVSSGISGAAKMKDANDTMNYLKRRDEKNRARLEEQQNATNHDMDKLGAFELAICESFQEFSDIYEKIKNRPQFKEYSKNGVNIPQYDGEKIREVSVGASVLIGGLGGAALGTAGGFAATGAATAAVMALGTASTGTAIASLSGAAATNATLAALGGGALAAGGGGIALGTTVLGAATLGVGLLVGGMIFNAVGSDISEKADEARAQVDRAERQIDKICNYCQDLSLIAIKYYDSLSKVNRRYIEHLARLREIVINNGKVDYKNDFTNADQLVLENTVKLVGILLKMCKVELVIPANNEEDVNTINYSEIEKQIGDVDILLGDIG
ncbi:MAG: hypothetical protein HFH72_05495 [Lachnospiraceae bacterium]|nr:hypothetical protein [Lachnospiraceae bacterium]